MRISVQVVRACALRSSVILLALLVLSVAVLQAPYWQQSATVNAEEGMPFIFFLTHYEILGDPNNPSGIRYHSDGEPWANASDGSSVILSGQGGWDPLKARAEGGGQYVIKGPAGAVKAQGKWEVTNFTSFVQWPGWLPAGFKEEGWQGPPGSSSWAGNLTLSVNLENLGNGVLSLWCLMPTTPTFPGPYGLHVSDGLTLTGGNFNFMDYRSQEKGSEGNMFYSNDYRLLATASADEWVWSWYVPIALAVGFALGMASVNMLRRRRVKHAPARVD